MDWSADERLGRRHLLARAGAVAVGGAVAGLAVGPAEAAGRQGPGPAGAGGGPAGGGGGPEGRPFGPVTVRPDDSRYDSLLRGDNYRFVGRPEEIRLAGSTEQVVRAVADAVRSGRRIAVRSGGHCFENFTGDPAVQLLLDLSPMDAVGFDPVMGAFAVQPGATLGRVYRALFKGWGVTIPAGGCPEVGAGGHLAGGGYGPLSRAYGSVVDYLHAVEVVVADRDGTVRAVVATRDPDDPNHDLWWAHTGGGGGNFGVVTRYWLRSHDTPDAPGPDAPGPDAPGPGTRSHGDPAALLPRAPGELRRCLVAWTWDEKMTERAFTTLLRNYGAWHERNSEPGTPAANLYAVLIAGHRKSGTLELVVQIDAGVPGSDAVLTDFVRAVTADVGATEPATLRGTMPWLPTSTWPGTGEAGNSITRRYKDKAGYLRRSLTDPQLATAYRYLTDGTGGAECGLLLVGYGGQVNAVPPYATAVAQRDSVMKAVYYTVWADESDDAAHLAWVRGFYRDVYRDTGGVPVPGEVSDGSYINYADTDLADPAWNTSGTPWHALYYKDNYPRLQQIKARWDPCNIFRHALAIEPPDQRP
ncbi:FAD-binding oxidoreductase [Kitasatospora sp. NPDC088160]|uniref:FAD-binding oxidoreductase n=1 Tax=Kitasatospora sp. NPDC088160 TaxID=3364072 RepID=UPI003826D54F